MATTANDNTSFYIKLDQPNRGYRPGETLTGYVVSRTNIPPGRPTTVYITLEGRSKAKIISHEKNRHGTWRSRVPLIYVIRELNPEPLRGVPERSFSDELVSGTYQHRLSANGAIDQRLQPYSTLGTNGSTGDGTSYRFELLLPEATQDLSKTPPFDGRYWAGALAGNTKEFTGFRHELPSTLAFGPRGAYKRSEGYIEYKLIATMSWTTRKMGPDMKEVIDLEPFQFAQCGFWIVNRQVSIGLDPYARLKVWTHSDFSTYHAGPDVTPDTKLTLKQRSKMLWGTNDTPAVKLRVDRSAPQRWFFGDKYDIEIDVLPPTQSEDSWKKRQWQAYDATAVTMGDITVDVVRQTKLRAQIVDDGWADQVVPPLKFVPSDPNLSPNCQFFRNSHGLPAAKVILDPLPPGLQPTSTTANISYKYEITMKVDVYYHGLNRWNRTFLKPVVGYRPSRIRARAHSVTGVPPPMPSPAPTPVLTPAPAPVPAPIGAPLTIRRKAVGSGARKPVGSGDSRLSMPPPPTAPMVPAAPVVPVVAPLAPPVAPSALTPSKLDLLPDIEDELADLGPYKLDPDDISGSRQTSDSVLRTLNYMHHAYEIGHIVVGVAMLATGSA